MTSYENENEKNSNRRIDIESNNPWLQHRSSSDLDRQSTQLADVYVNEHLRGSQGGQSSNTMKRELAAHYRTTEPILVRYTSRKIDHLPKTDSAITDSQS